MSNKRTERADPRNRGRQRPQRLLAAALLGLAVVLLWTACNSEGQQGFNVTVEPGRVSCEAFLQFKTYRYRAEVVLDLAARDPSMEPTDPYRPDPFKLTQIIEATVEGQDRISATIENVEFGQEPLPVVVIGDIYWIALAGRWQANPLRPGIPYPIPYLPRDTCNALAPDLRLAGLKGEPEEVNGIPSLKYSFDSLRSDLPDRHPGFGPQSDVARLVNEFSGAVWVAEEGKYISKVDLSGTGHYENGRELTVRIFYELADINDKSIKVEPPTQVPLP